ncbi:hypothetical protein BDA96_07G131100 [Sorghum bicolor]|uniref:Secreted protein n=2 Tax=Sorghum bicolor TaxID=4558 RepID=A0A921QK93_SORBI|nr:hypothetical protein SORBI_3007G122300 [Sorghum bicolor]KAG0523534.1 hypothetical protein BDA96_07G131100 [Sorghum bicolor]
MRRLHLFFFVFFGGAKLARTDRRSNFERIKYKSNGAPPIPYVESSRCSPRRARRRRHSQRWIRQVYPEPTFCRFLSALRRHLFTRLILTT